MEATGREVHLADDDYSEIRILRLEVLMPRLFVQLMTPVSHKTIDPN